MHDPQTLAFRINNPFKKYSPIISIWHKDPERDGTDDSCGWVIRPRHIDPELIKKVRKEFQSEWDTKFKSESSEHIYYCGWFNDYGENILSVQSIVFNMHLYAAKILLNPTGKTDPGKMWDIAYRFMHKNLVHIMYFAENNRDSMRDIIVRKFEIGCKEPYDKEKMIDECVRIVCSNVMNNSRKWYQHPRWHIHHWKITFHPIMNFKRRYIQKCSVCGKRGFKSAAISDWSGNRMWHQHCDKSNRKPNNL